MSTASSEKGGKHDVWSMEFSSTWNARLVGAKSIEFTEKVISERRRHRRLGHAVIAVIGNHLILSRSNEPRFGDLHNARIVGAQFSVISEKLRDLPQHWCNVECQICGRRLRIMEMRVPFIEFLRTASTWKSVPLAMSRTVKIWFKISARYLKAVIPSVQWNPGVSVSVNCMLEKRSHQRARYMGDKRALIDFRDRMLVFPVTRLHWIWQRGFRWGIANDICFSAMPVYVTMIAGTFGESMSLKSRRHMSHGCVRLLEPFARTARMRLNPTAYERRINQMRTDMNQINKTFLKLAVERLAQVKFGYLGDLK